MADFNSDAAGSPADASGDPFVQSFQFDSGGVGALKNSVNIFRGDVNFPVNLVKLSGRNGLDLSITAFYDSNVRRTVATWNQDAPTGILGLGWSLGYEQIVRVDTSSAAPADRTYYIRSSGASSQLVHTGNAGDGSWQFQAQAFQFWRIAYYPADERWEVTKEDGSCSVYGGGASGTPGSSTGQSVQWGVQWGIWSGPSAATAGQAVSAVAWNLSAVRTPWGDQQTYAYNAGVPGTTEAVGPNGKSYTKAAYLTSITDAVGRTLAFNYRPKVYNAGVQCEYQDPHKTQPNTNPDAYQSRYETLFLDTIDVRNPAGARLFSVAFSYTLANYGTSSDPAYPFTWKRLLTAVHQINGDGGSEPGMAFTYQPANTPNPGALASVTYPTGGSVAYRYDTLSLSTSRDTTIPNPFPASGGTPAATPRVWFGSDYLVVTWYDDAGGRLQLSVYTWVGRWVTMTPSQIIPAKMQLATLVVAAGTDYFALLYQDTAKNQQRILLYRRNPNATGQWAQTDRTQNLKAGAAATLVAAGDDFLALYNPGFAQGGALQGLAWNWRTRTWGTLPVPTIAPAAAGTVAMSAGRNYLLVLAYDPTRKLGSFTLPYRNDQGQWNAGFAWTSPFTVDVSNSDVPFPLTLSPGPSYAVATYVTSFGDTTVASELRLFQFDANFNVTNASNPVVKAYTTTVINGTAQFPALSTAAGTSMVANGVHTLRNVGTSWVAYDAVASPSAGATYRVAASDDVVVVAATTGGTVSNVLAGFNPNQPTAGGWTTQPVATPGDYPTAAGDYLTAGTQVFYRGPTGAWGKLPTALTSSTKVQLASIQNRAPSYIAYQDDNGAGSQTHVALLKNGGVSQLINLSGPAQKVYVESPSTPQGTTLAGPRAFVTYPAGQSFDTAASLHLYQVGDTAVTGPVTDAPVAMLTINDGYPGDTPYAQSYAYDLAYAIVAADTGVAQYSKASVSPGTGAATNANGPTPTRPFGRTDYYYSNGIAPQGGVFYPVGWVYNYQGILNGTLLATQVFDANNRAVGGTVNYWQPTTTQAGTSNYLFGGYARLVRTDKSVDGVTKTTQTAYDPTTGLPVTVTTSSLLGGAQQRTYVKSLLYAWQVPGYASAANLVKLNVLSPVVQTTLSTDGTPTSVSVTTWKNWDTTGATWKWAPCQTYRWLGSGSAAFDFTQANPTGWLKTSEVRVRMMPQGAIQETADAMDVVTSVQYDTDGVLPMARFVNASAAAGQASYLDFEPYAGNGPWAISSSTPIVSGDAHTGTRCLSLPAGSTGPAATFQASAAAGDFILSCWVKTSQNFGTDGGTAGWQVVVTAPGGAAVGAPITLNVADTKGQWAYLFAVLPLTSLRQTNSVPASSVLALAVTSRNGKTTASFLLDDVRVSPLVCSFRGQVFDPTTWLVTANVGGDGGTARYLYAGDGQRFAAVGPGDPLTSVTRLNSPYDSRRGNADVFNPADPNRVLTVTPRLGGLYETLGTSSDWTSRWSTSTAGWAVANGTLAYTGSGASTLTLTAAQYTSRYGVCFELTTSAALAGPVTVAIGQAASVGWNPATGDWTLTLAGQTTTRNLPGFRLAAAQYQAAFGAATASPTLADAFTAAGYPLSTAATIAAPASGRWTLTDPTTTNVYYALLSGGQIAVYQLPARWLLVAAGNTLLFTADGQPVFSADASGALTGAFALTLPGPAAVGDLLAFREPVIGAALTDAAGRQMQKQLLAGGQSVVQATLYDAAGNAAVQTKPASLAADATHPPLAYRDDFITGFDWTTGVMTGAVATAYPNDSGYPYSRKRYEASPVGRVVESGLPGSDFAINLTVSPRHTTSYSYAPSDGTFGLPANEYMVERSLDPRAVSSLKFIDKTGAVVGKAVMGTDGKTQQQMTQFDPAGNPVTVQTPNYFQPPAGAAGDWVITRGFDALGRQTLETTTDKGTTQTLYDLSGRPRIWQDARGAAGGYVLYQKYDALGRTVEVGSYPSTWGPSLQSFANTDPTWPPATTTWTRRFTYDGDGTSATALGRLTRAVTNNAAASTGDVVEDYAYDVAGNVLAQGLQVSDFDSSRYVVQTAFDNMNNPVQVTYPPGQGGDPTTVAYTLDDLARVVGVGSGQGTTFATYAYNADGTIATEALNPGGAGAANRQFSYAPPGWPQQVATTFQGNAGSFSVARQFTSGGYNGAGQYNGLVAQQSSTYGWTAGAPAPDNFAYGFAYNSLGQLQTGQDTPDATKNLGVAQPVAYDPNGNITGLSLGTQAYQYAYAGVSAQVGSNRVSTVTATGGQTARSYQYDADGNVTQLTAGTTTLNLTLDPLTQLATHIGITGGPATALDLAYDANRRRVYKRVTGGSAPGSRLYVRGGRPNPLLDVTNTGGAPARRYYLYGPSGLIGVYSAGSWNFVLKDFLGSPRVVLGANGAVVGGYDYWPFGATLRTYGAATLPYQFTGQEYDAETGLYNYNARLYDPVLQRFLSPDPGKEYVSPYVYAANNPVLVTDPTGMFSVGDFFSAIAHFFVDAVLLVGGVLSLVAGAVASAIPGGQGVGVGLTLLGSTLLGAGIGGLTSDVTQLATGHAVSWGDWGIQVGIGAVAGLISGGFAVGSGAIVDAIAASSFSKAASFAAGGGGRIAFNTLVGGAAGNAFAGITGEVLGNVAAGNEPMEGVGFAATLGAILGATGGLLSEGLAWRVSKLAPIDPEVEWIPLDDVNQLPNYGAIQDAPQQPRQVNFRKEFWNRMQSQKSRSFLRANAFTAVPGITFTAVDAVTNTLWDDEGDPNDF